MPKKKIQQSQFFHIQGGVNVKSARLWEATLQLFSCEVALGRIGFLSSARASIFKFPLTLPGQDLKPTPLWMEADISTQSAQASIEKNTVPCIPAGPKSCLVRKMAWSWYSAWSGSRRCCVLAHRHTCSRLRDGLPRSIRLIDWTNAKTRTMMVACSCIIFTFKI